MIGLITTDEVMYAGGTVSPNEEYYLCSGVWYWTMTPNFFASGDAIVYSVDNVGNLYSYGVYDSNGAVRPVVSLKSDAISGGSGTAASPFLVG